MAVEYQGKGSTKGIVLQLESKRPWQDTLDLRKRTPISYNNRHNFLAARHRLMHSILCAWQREG